MPEYFDIYDENENPTGEVIERAEVHSHGEVLMQKRAQAKETYPGLYDISAAGHIDAGEKSIHAALRETNEELGIEVHAEQLEHIFSTKQQQVLNGGTYINNEIVDVYILFRDLDTSNMKLQVEEVESVKFVPHKELYKSLIELDPSYVPMASQIVHDYDKFFKILREKFP